MDKSARVYVAGHAGSIGSAVYRALVLDGFSRVLTTSPADIELTDALRVGRFIDCFKPEYVVLAAGRVGEVVENQIRPADFMYTNLAIQLKVLRVANRAGAQKLILFGSSSMHPRECAQPMPETALFSGHPEPTRLANTVPTIAEMQMCLACNQQYGEKRFIPVIPNSAFGPNDNFDPKSCHVFAVLIRRFHEAKHTAAPSVTLWGSGNPRREFIPADDIANGILALLKGKVSQLQFPLNLGTGKDFYIGQISEAIAKVVGYARKLKSDRSKPDRAPGRLLDSTHLINFEWQPKVALMTGLKLAYEWYLENTLKKGVQP
jgi:GDP-L-fucose synthase